VTPFEADTISSQLGRFGGPDGRVRVELRGSGGLGLDRLDSVQIAAAPDEGRVAISLGPAGESDHALPDLLPGDRLDVSAQLEVGLDHDGAEGGPPPVGVPYDYAPGVVAGLRLADGDGTVIATGRATPLRLGPGRRRTRLIVEDSFRVPEAPGLDSARLELLICVSHEDARPGHLLLLGGGPQRRAADRAGQISVARMRPGGHRLPAGEETKQLRARRLEAGAGPRGVYSLPLPGLRRGEQLMVRSCVKATAAPAGSVSVGTRLFLADSPAQAEPDERSYAALVAPDAGRVANGGRGDCLPGDATTYRDVGVVLIRENAIRPVYLNVAAAAGENGAGGPDGGVELVPGGWLSVVRLEPGRRL